MPDENTAPKGDPEKSRGELNEGRPHPTKDVAAGEYESGSDRLHAEKDKIRKQPLGPYNRDARSGDNPEVDQLNEREAPRAFPDRDPAKKKTGEF
jgi:hypothetical protein